ncbi:MAG: IPT/TIG domain-containing protein, partial [Tepidiformaceae bacterium]
NFAYSAAPFVTGIDPSGGPITGGTVVTITGSGLTGATAVNFGGTSVVPVVVNDTTLTAVAPAHTQGTVDVIVTTPMGISANTAADNYAYGALAVITGVNPATGPIAGGTTVTLTGTGFTGATLVTFGAVTAVPTNVTDTSLTVNTPAQAAGEVNILVTTPVGISAANAAATFKYGSASTTSYTLFFRWSLVVWNGADNVDITTALKGLETPDNAATNDVSSQVTALFRYNNALQKFEAFFPGTSNVPGANDFTVFNTGTAYWVAIAGPNSITWTIVAG